MTPMSDPIACPSTHRLRLLLAADPSADQAVLIAHLDDCPRCQRKLEELAGANLALLRVARGLSRETFAEEGPARQVLGILGSDPQLTVLHYAHDSAAWARSVLQ